MIVSEIPKVVFQTTLKDEWDTIQEQIDRSKIKRYPYKKLIGMSLTRYILSCKDEGLTPTQTLARILGLDGIKILLWENNEERHNILKNLEISVCARFSEEKSRGR